MAFVLVEDMDRAPTGVLATSSLSETGRRDTYSRMDRNVFDVETDLRTARDIDPCDPLNIKSLLAVE